MLRKTCRQRTINAGAFADLRRLVGLSEIPSRCALLAIDAGGLCISKLVRVPPRTTAVRNECRCSSRPIASGRATRDQSKAARWSYKMAPSRSERPTNRRSGRSSSASGWPERVPQLRTRRAEPPNQPVADPTSTQLSPIRENELAISFGFNSRVFQHNRPFPELTSGTPQISSSSAGNSPQR